MNGCVGGVFGLNELYSDLSQSNIYHRLNDDTVYFLNARSAIFSVIAKLRPSKVWLPSYLCSVIIDMLDEYDVSYSFFPVNDELQLDDDEWIEVLGPNDLVVFIDYFGFNFKLPSDSIKSKGSYILEDASQNLLSTIDPSSDFIVYSPRKFIGIPDGGILYSKYDLGIRQDEFSFPKWWIQSFYACLSRMIYDENLTNSKVWYELFKLAEQSQTVENSRASDLSMSILKHGVDWNSIRSQRISNYKLLLDELGEVAIYKNIVEGIVPLGFPICINNRDGLQKKLADNNIYCPIHWVLPKYLNKFSSSYDLSECVLTLICDQRYGQKEMNDIVNICEEFI